MLKEVVDPVDLLRGPVHGLLDEPTDHLLVTGVAVSVLGDQLTQLAGQTGTSLFQLGQGALPPAVQGFSSGLRLLLPHVYQQAFSHRSSFGWVMAYRHASSVTISAYPITTLGSNRKGGVAAPVRNGWEVVSVCFLTYLGTKNGW